ncbi:hypothetical protein [Allosphingosinicella deserti]|uniref:Uncharacterized protein n=1 Tax=Allosphingosinicella deserti TaxID=2116704 RepID=A0A2P7QEL4_9SPHN|nr:hypothetical protein [Sphingomonas deserti]PSJ36375.1 hypothetical protein C7I55_26385 [Sphingomonas deserti]
MPIDQEATAAARRTEFTVRRPDAPSCASRHFEVSGEDADGLIHSFHTDCPQQAGDIAEILCEDLTDVRIIQRYPIA